MTNKVSKSFLKNSHLIDDLKLCSIRLIDNAIKCNPDILVVTIPSIFLLGTIYVKKKNIRGFTQENAKLKNCVCDSVTSNYTPQSIWAAHDAGAPVAVTLGLSFQETELVMAEDVHGTEHRQGGQVNRGGY